VKASQFYRGIRSELNIRSRDWGTFFIALLAISYFIFRIRNRMPQSDLGLEEYLDRLQKQYSIRDDTTLVIFQFGRQKKEVHYFNKLTAFIDKWFRDFIEGRERTLSLLAFLDSLTATQTRSKNLKVMGSLREKLIFYLLKHNQVNGDLLTKLVAIKMQDSLKADKPFGVFHAKQFFAKL
jgi:hypothetical protein